jgi:hypothetical protein
MKIADLRIVGVVTVIGVLGGFLISQAWQISLYRGMMPWVICCVAAGLVQCTVKEAPLRLFLIASATFTLALAAGFMGFYFVRGIVSLIQIGGHTRLFVRIASGVMIDPLDPDLRQPIVWLAIVTILATFCLTISAAVSGPILLQGSKVLYDFGPEGVDKLRRLVVAVTALIAALLVLWSAFG